LDHPRAQHDVIVQVASADASAGARDGQADGEHNQ
jgi:hypothetical protein